MKEPIDRKSPAEPKEASYYELHTGAVDDLLNAKKGSARHYSREELNRYRSGGKTGKFRMPVWLKAVLWKWWLNGAVCYFTFWGLGVYLPNQLDILVAAAVILGLVNNLVINHFVRHNEAEPYKREQWIMVNVKGAGGIFLDLLYAGFLLFMVVTFYNMLNAAILAARGGGDTIPVPVEPILFGLFYTAADLACVGLRNGLRKVVEDAKRKA